MRATFQRDLHELTEEDLERSRKDLQAEFASLRAEIGTFRADLIKWMFVLWIATVLSLGGLMLALQTAFK